MYHSGPIPAELGQLGKLEKLDLGFNKLTGTTPPSFTLGVCSMWRRRLAFHMPIPSSQKGWSCLLYILTVFCFPKVPSRLNWAHWRNWSSCIWGGTNLPVLSPLFSLWPVFNTMKRNLLSICPFLRAADVYLEFFVLSVLTVFGGVVCDVELGYLFVICFDCVFSSPGFCFSPWIICSFCFVLYLYSVFYPQPGFWCLSWIRSSLCFDCVLWCCCSLFVFRFIRRNASIGIETSEVSYWSLNITSASLFNT